MAKKKRRSRRRAAFSVLNALEAYVYAAILTEGVAGTSPIGLLTGKTDLTSKSFVEHGVIQTTVTGATEISLGDIMSDPTLALSTMAQRFQANLLPMALAGFTTSISFRVGKRLLRKPISTINRSILKPALGAGIRL